MYRQVWYCFEDLIIRKIMVQSKFDLDSRFDSYNFFRFKIAKHVGDVSNFVY